MNQTPLNNRLHAEQFFNFGRFLFSGQWYLSLNPRDDGPVA